MQPIAVKSSPGASSPSIAVALGGGGARGIAHVHVAEVLDELGLRPRAIAGSSIGSIVGVGIASGMSGREIRDFMAGIFCDRGEVAKRLWQSRPERWSDLFNGGFRISQFNIEKILDAFLPDSLPARVEDLPIPMVITAADFYEAREVIIERGDLRSAVAASCAIPPVFGPVMRDNVVLVDGGLCNPVPFDHLFGKADIVIGVDVIGKPVRSRKDKPTTFEAMLGSNQITMAAIIENKFRLQAPQIFLQPDVAHIGLLDFLKFEQILNQSAGIREELKRAIDAAFAATR